MTTDASRLADMVKIARMEVWRRFGGHSGVLAGHGDEGASEARVNAALDDLEARVVERERAQTRVLVESLRFIRELTTPNAGIEAGPVAVYHAARLALATYKAAPEAVAEGQQERVSVRATAGGMWVVREETDGTETVVPIESGSVLTDEDALRVLAEHDRAGQQEVER